MGALQANNKVGEAEAPRTLQALQHCSGVVQAAQQCQRPQARQPQRRRHPRQRLPARLQLANMPSI